MKKQALHCVRCGADITRAMKIYPGGLKGGAYCYDCAEQVRLEKIAQKKNISEEAKIVKMYKSGLRVSEIADRTGHSMFDIYQIITEELAD